MRRALPLLTAALATAALVIVASTAGASSRPFTTTIGADLAVLGAADAGACPLKGSGERTCSFAFVELSEGAVEPDGFLADVDGKVARFRVATTSPSPGTASVEVRLRVLRGGLAGRPGPATRYYKVPLKFDGEHSFPAGLGVRDGDAIALDVKVVGNGLGEAAAPITSVGNDVNTLEVWSPALDTGVIRPADEVESGVVLGLNADIERSDRTPPRTKLTYRPRQNFLKTGKLRVTVRSSEDGTVYAGNQVEVPAKSLTLGGYSTERHLHRGVKRTLTLVFPEPNLARARRAFAHGNVVVAKVTVSAGDEAGNESGVTVAVIRPKR